MPRINEHYPSLKATYLFAEIERRTEATVAVERVRSRLER